MEKCCGELLERSVAKECIREVSWRSVVKESKSVVEKCCGELL